MTGSRLLRGKRDGILLASVLPKETPCRTKIVRQGVAEHVAAYGQSAGVPRPKAQSYDINCFSKEMPYFFIFL